MATTTDILAWIGALSGSAALAWDAYKWKASGPKLSITASPGMVSFTPGVGAGKEKHILVKVRNAGSAATTLTQLAMSRYPSRWSRWRLRQTECFIVATPLLGTLPKKLDVGEEWAGMIIQDDQLETIAAPGDLWCEIYHSWSKRPARTRLVIGREAAA